MKPPLRVAYLLHRFPYLTTTFIMREMNCLRAQGVDIQIYSLLPPKHKIVHEEAKPLIEHTRYAPWLSWPILRACAGYLVRSPRKLGRAVWAAWRQCFREPLVLARVLLLLPKMIYFADLMRQQNIDHIHAHFVWLEGITSSVVSALNGTTYTIHPHAFGLFCRNQASVRNELVGATEIVTISEFHRQYIQQLCPQIPVDRIHVVYCGIDTDTLRRTSKPSDNSPPVIVSIGRLIEKKGFEYLVRACTQLNRDGHQVRSQIIGSGPLHEKLAALVDGFDMSEQIELAGSRSQAEIKQLLEAADIFVLPCVVAKDGDRDGIPVVLMEAMALELPVVSCPVTGIPDLIHDGETGLLVPSRDTDQLVKAIERLLAEPALRQRLGGCRPPTR